MKKWLVSSYNKRENIDREKYGQVTFLKKYIKRYKSYTKFMKWLLPMVVIVNLALVGIYLSAYVSLNKLSDLVILILWSIATIIWIFILIIDFTVHFTHIDNKMIEWKKELAEIKESE